MPSAPSTITISLQTGASSFAHWVLRPRGGRSPALVLRLVSDLMDAEPRSGAPQRILAAAAQGAAAPFDVVAVAALAQGAVKWSGDYFYVLRPEDGKVHGPMARERAAQFGRIGSREGGGVRELWLGWPFVPGSRVLRRYLAGATVFRA